MYTEEGRKMVYSYGLYYSIQYGFIDTVRKILNHDEIMFDDICPFDLVKRKNIEIQKLLLEHSNVSMGHHNCEKLVHTNNMELIRMAMNISNEYLLYMFVEALHWGKIHIVMTILKETNLSEALQRDMLINACIYSETKVVGSLLEKYSICLSFNELEMLQQVCYDRNYQLVELLLEKRVFHPSHFPIFMRDTIPFLPKTIKIRVLGLLRKHNYIK